MTKLVDIVAKHYKEWPENAFVISQASDGEVIIEYSREPFDWNHAGVFLEKASDWVCAEVTKDEWQEARNKLKEKKVNKDGWIRHRGGKCPVDSGTLIDVSYRDGVIAKGIPAKSLDVKSSIRMAMDWTHF